MSDPGLAGVDLWSTDNELFAAVRDGAALVVSRGAVAHAHGAEVELEGFRARVETAEMTFEATLTPVVDAGPAAAELPRSVQICELQGTVAVGGRPKALHGKGALIRTSGSAGDGRRRFVTAADPEGPLVILAAIRPEAEMPHGDERVTGYELSADEGSGARLFEEVRLSTVYDADGLPRTAGAELYRPGDELPARLSGEAIGPTLELADGALAIAFFRWTLIGRPAWGTYELEPAP